MSEGSKATKRARLDEQDAARTLHCDDLFFSDGNIILRAYSANNHTYTFFRVHKSLLGMNSVFFRDLFGGDSSSVFDASSEQYEGLPVMDMQDDPKDLEDFLRALYIPGFMRRHLDTKARMYDFPKMYNGVMRMVKKFDAPQLYDVFSSELRAAWPPDLREAEARWKLHDARWENCPGDWLERRLRSHPNAGYGLRMAVDYHIPDVLPPLFYELALSFGVGNIVDGRETCCGDLTALNSNELRTLLLGSAALRTHISSSFPPDVAEARDLNVDLDNCSATPSCSEVDLKAFWRDLSEHMRDGDDPWTVLQDHGMFEDYSLCTHCRDAVETHLRDYREDLWPRLPEIFQLGEYDVSANWPQSPNAANDAGSAVSASSLYGITFI
ncbi:hypothetical protein PENSPDRAFT_692599 [Peniophora sp. CONT]|nr:hypothetical protein PENSPDRAFT_692599 [Peniophora sp. CONT]